MKENKLIKVLYYSSGLEKKKDPFYLLWKTLQKKLERKGYRFKLYEKTEIGK
ncbi:unnamed protein product [marine sediment metagenome]|uniref:Uncharacterized protein n=1 Tax=marine sediment metagenome TaxID=412755 RepID=X0YRB1_9ZZZZ